MLRGRLFLVVVLVLLVCGAAGAGTASHATVGTTITRVPSLEDSLFQRINAIRHRNGLAPLVRSAGLTRAAASHSHAMAAFGFFTHESRNGMRFSTRIERFYGPRAPGWTVGENLAFASGSVSPELIVASWMSSPGHRANLLRRMFRDAGIAIVHHPSAGGIFGGAPTWIVTLDIGAR